MSGTRADPIALAALRRATVATLLVLLAALAGATTQVLPWALDPSIPWIALAPFARSLFEVALEAAILTGWSVGWALAAARLVSRGEANVLASLGEAPWQTLRRLAPQGALFVVLLAATSTALGRDAAAPGRIVRALVKDGRSACSDAMDRATPRTLAVPFVGATWLCGPGGPRLVGKAPLGNLVFSAADARVTDDLRRIDLDDARLMLPGAPGGSFALRLHVGALRLGGLAPLAQASALPPALRALIMVLAGAGASSAAVLCLLVRRRPRGGSVAAAVVGVSGPLAALVMLRGLERRVPEVASGGWLLAFVLVPVVSVVAVFVVVAVVGVLPTRSRSATK